MKQWLFVMRYCIYTFYTRHLLHQTTFTTNNFYTRHPLHQKPFTPDTFYTKHRGPRGLRGPAGTPHKNIPNFKALDSNRPLRWISAEGTIEWKMAKQNRNKCPQKEQKQHLFTNHFILGFINVKSTTLFNTLKGCSWTKTTQILGCVLKV